MAARDVHLQIAQWTLERNLEWIAATEVKVGAIVAINTAMLGGLAAAYGSSTQVTDWAHLGVFSSACFSMVAVFCAAMSLLPRTDGPKRSLLFFGRIAELSVADYCESFKKAAEIDFLEDCLQQIHQNAAIAAIKFRWVRRSAVWSFLSILPWVSAISLLLEK